MSDKKYLKWLSFQPSCLDGAFNQYQDGVGRNIPCHVRRSKNAGTGYKPKFSAVSLTSEQHDIQHRYGEKHLLVTYGLLESDASNEQAKEWFDNKAKEMSAKWKSI